ncbi:MAG TPA: endolytic transglycosylase MltG [Nitrospiria bacterium]|nr:endolytic transglycosylase MltG [Nitrospiria bacterium]
MELTVQKRIGRMAIPLLFIGTALLFVLVQEVTFLYIPPDRDRVQKVLEIPEGTTLRKTARLLFQNGLITSVESFVVVGKILAIERHIIPGEYAFHTRMLPLEIIGLLKSGRVIEHEITIPEGSTLAQIGQWVEEKHLARADEFIRRANDPVFVQSLGYEADSLEGYLYPETYYFSKRVGTDGILRALVKQFETVYTPEMEKRAQEIGMTRQEVVTLASIIEKETSVEAERPIISAVFHNRIRKNIPLQSDPTVIYSLPHFNGNLTRKNLRIPSPYNTYRIKGLPPGPIANPGRAALWAALYPAPVDYLYFVSKNDGTHYFSKTLAEHNRAVQKYQKRRLVKST